MRRIALALLTMLTLAAPASAAPRDPLDTTGRWVTDATGRVWITHGVNMVYKRPPYLPSKTGFGADDVEFLRRHGFNSVRLGTIYTAVEPRPGVYDDTYVRGVRETAEAIAGAGIYTLVDFHQDLFNERYGGEGFPDWAVFDDGLPAEPLVGFPLTYVSSPGGNRAWQSLWDDREGLHGRFAAAWGHVAGLFRGAPRLMGYDLLNEPWPGPAWTTCANTEGCRAFEEGPLAALQGKAMRAIRARDARNIIWYEPVVTSQFGTKYWIPNPTGDPRAAMSFHIYCLAGAAGPPGAGGCDATEQLSMDNAQARADANGDPSMMSEWGATADPAVIVRQAARADRAMIGEQWWHYCACDDPTTAGPGDVQALVSDPAKPPEGANVLADKLALVVRPYPQLVAGTPKAYGFERSSRTFTLTYSTARPDGKGAFRAGSVSEVFVPRLHYPDGYAVEVRGGSIESPARASLLRIASAPGADEVRVTVKPGAGTGFKRLRPVRVTLVARRGRVTGRVVAPEGVEREEACAGTVRIRARVAGRAVTRQARVTTACAYAARLPRTARRITARFAGNASLLPRTARR